VTFGRKKINFQEGYKFLFSPRVALIQRVGLGNETTRGSIQFCRKFRGIDVRFHSIWLFGYCIHLARKVDNLMVEIAAVKSHDTTE